MSFGTELRHLFNVILLASLTLIVPRSLSFAQSPANLSGTARMGSNPSVTQIDPSRRIGRHTVAEWRSLIDSTWGEGQTTEEKLRIFDLFWNAVDQRYAGFQGIADNWQQMHAYRDTIAQGVSRGRFAGILTQLVRSLHDGHVFMCDKKIASTSLHEDVPVLVPAANSFPSHNWNAVDHFGAALTPLADSTLLVYKTVTDHPLGLVPGDIILGYDGKPWKDLYKELLEVHFPLSFFFAIACSEDAATHEWLGTAGMNWQFFDTLDVVKHATGDTVHLPTDLISGPMPGIHATEQMPISGVPFPDVGNGHRVSYGYLGGTKIGYIYVLGWSTPSVDADFLNAVNAFMQDSSSDGLIIDLRTNEGCDNPRWNKGFSRLFNQGLNVIDFLERANSSNHLAMQTATEWDSWVEYPGSDRDLYDRPIAVLCGPWTSSGGDISVQMLRQHPMVRTFGKPTQGAFGVFTSIGGLSSSEWFTGVTVAEGYTPPDWSHILNRASVPVDEEVWLSPDGVAKGEDDVVQAALEWITTLTYAHHVSFDCRYIPPGQDSLLITARLANPLNHSASVSAITTDGLGVVRDSLMLFDDGLHGDASAGDSLFGCYIPVPADENMFRIDVRTDDNTESTYRRLPDVACFTTAGPLDVVGDTLRDRREYAYCNIRPYVRNRGNSATVTGAKVRIHCDDPWVKTASGYENPVPDISPGETVGCSSWNTISYIDSLAPDSLYFNLRYEITIGGLTYWTYDTLLIGVKGQKALPVEFSLEQNYPNPFNPVTAISYQLSAVSYVSLKVYDVLGREVATLVNRKQGPGTYEVKFDASGMSSGVYFCRIKAGAYTSVKKMLMLK